MVFHPSSSILHPFVFAVILLPVSGALAAPQSGPPEEVSIAELPYGFSETIVAGGLDGATSMAVAPDGRVFICEQTGRLRVVKDGHLLPEPFLELEVDSHWERGLIGIAFDPQFAANGYVYVCYVAPEPYPHHVISRFTARGDKAIAGSEKILLKGDDQTKLGGSVPAGHQGGPLQFGHDGKLYVGIGEQTAGRPSQRLDSLLGKILRINADGSIPADNPFIGQTDGKYRAIWARGLRNPFGLAMEPGTGRMLINDVGGRRWEEINLGRAGANYGWPDSEGPTPRTDHVSPLYAYSETPEQSITGGVFYAGVELQFPQQYHGKYFFADYSQGWIRVLDPDNSKDVQTFATDLHRPVDLDLAPDGSLYYLNRNLWVKDGKFVSGTSSLHRVFYTERAAAAAPLVRGGGQQRLVALGRSFSLEVQADGQQPLAYQWQRDNKPIAGATGARLNIPAAGPKDDGARFRCIVSNQQGFTKSAAFTTWTAELETGTSLANQTDGLRYWLFEAGGERLPDAKSQLTIESGVTSDLELTSRLQRAWSGAILSGYLRVPRDDVYHFSLSSYGVAKLIVAGQQVTVLRRGNDAVAAGQGSVALRAGLHPLEMYVAKHDQPLGLQVHVSGGGLQEEPLQRLELSHDASAAEAADLPQRPRSTLAIPADPEQLPRLLSETGAFQSLDQLTPAPRLMPYDVIAPLWSDGARKFRWIVLPGDQTIEFSEDDAWQFPAGTVFIKHFELGDGQGREAKRLETRFLYVDRGGTGYGATYRWRSDGSDAELLDEGLHEEVSYVADGRPRTVDWSYPSRQDCLLCHTKQAGFVLGANTRQLNRPATGMSSETDQNQLHVWSSLKMFHQPLEDARIAQMDQLASLDDQQTSLESRVRSYLDANCAQCHRPGVVRGPFDARFNAPLALQHWREGELLGADLGVADARLVVPGAPEKSMIYLRMQRRHDVFGMPPLASSVADEQALEVVRQWIEELD